LSANCSIPIRHQLFLVDFYPRPWTNLSSAVLSVPSNTAPSDSFIISRFNVYVWLMVLFIVEVVHKNDNAVKH
jgi:hypothetical protein